MSVQIERLGSDEKVALHVADALVLQLEKLQAEGRTPRVVLTGGRIAARIYQAIVREPGVVDWENVDIWFSDERYLPEGHPDRNYEQTHSALFGHMPFDYDRLHPIAGATDGYNNDADQAAREYAAELAAAAPPSGPWFDIAILSIGPDGHCASLFPDRVDPMEPAPVVAIHNAPKLPSTRVSMSLATLSKAREVWFVAVGAEKARAVADSLESDDVRAVPAAGPKGVERTLWIVDHAAAGLLG